MARDLRDWAPPFHLLLNGVLFDTDDEDCYADLGLLNVPLKGDPFLLAFQIPVYNKGE